jgi:hypothetical protein
MRTLRVAIGGVVLACIAPLMPGVPALAAAPTPTADCPAAGPRDTEPPEVHEVTLGTEQVDVTAGSVEVPVRARVIDPGGAAPASGVASVTVQLNHPGFEPSRGAQPGGSARLTPAGGDWWAGVLTVGQWERYSGVWEVLKVEAWDTAGNQGLAPGVLEGRPAPSLTITPHPLDLLQPYLADLVLRRTVVDARERPGHLRVRVRATDTGGSGVSAVTVAGTSLSHVSGTADDGWWAGAATVPRWGPDGSRRIQVKTFDAAGNVTWSSPGRLRDRGLPSRFTVRSTPDLTAPLASRVRLGDSTVEVVPSGAEVRVHVRAADALSGVRRVQAVLRASDGSWRWSALMALRAGTRRDGVWRGALVLPCGFEAGSYRLELRLADRAGNGRAAATALTLRVR